jgi:2'-5' RNA ligase
MVHAVCLVACSVSVVDDGSMKIARSSVLTAFCLSNSRRRGGRQHFVFRLLATSNDPTNSNKPHRFPQAPSEEDTKDWFVDGRETARRLKIELGLMINEEENASADEGDGVPNSLINTSRDEAMESGRKAALAFLKSFNDEEDNNHSQLQMLEERNFESFDAIGQSFTQPSSRNQFTFPSRKSHCLTICLVPPPSATNAWERLTDARKECKDPGFYRWPPHANLLYPFLEPSFDKESSKSKDEQLSEYRKQLSKSLTSVAAQCKPFDVEMNALGTFGGNSRGVLWAYPISEYSLSGNNDSYDEEPLITLQKILEEHFPMCTDQRKQGTFTPHITLSHYGNINDALEAKGRMESKWEPISFHVKEIYLLERKGEDGQFKVLAKIPLGLEGGDVVNFYDEPSAFPGMPDHEEEWVRNERMTMKNRRKNNYKRRRKGGMKPF